jgi:hypothetical protein
MPVRTIRRASPRSPARLKAQREQHRALWGVVEGAVVDAFQCHPDYLTEKGSRHAVESITKRVAGQLAGLITEAQQRGSLGAS